MVKSWVFRNPHPFLYVEVTDEKGVKNEPLKVARADGTVIPGSGRGGIFAPEAGQREIPVNWILIA